MQIVLPCDDVHVAGVVGAGQALECVEAPVGAVSVGAKKPEDILRIAVLSVENPKRLVHPLTLSLEFKKALC